MSEPETVAELKARQEFTVYQLIILRLKAWRLEQELAAIKRLIEEKLREGG